MLLERDNLQNLQSVDTQGSEADPRHSTFVTNGGAVAGGHTTPPNASRQPPKVQDLSIFRTFRDGWWDDPKNWGRHKCRQNETARAAKVSDRPSFEFRLP